MRRRTVVILLALVLLSALVLAIAAQRRLPAGVTRGKIKSAGLDRTYLLYVPKTVDPATPTPLVISMHGFASWPANQMSVSQWNKLADQHGFIVVYPSGTGFPKRWNTSGRTGEDAADDVAFLSDLIDTLSQQFTIDPARIYANGLSNGAGMANLLACELSDRIAAIGGVAGAYTNPAKGCESLAASSCHRLSRYRRPDRAVCWWRGRSWRFRVSRGAGLGSSLGKAQRLR